MTPLPATEEVDTTRFEVDTTRFEVNDLGAAEWAMAKLADKLRELDAIREQHAEWVRKYDEWLQDMSRPLEQSIQYFEGLLKDYARRRREETGEKTCRLPSGQVRTTTVNPKIEVVDEEQVIAWLEAYAEEMGQPITEYLKIDVRPKLDPLKKLAKIVEGPTGLVAAAHGQPIPGVIVKPGDVSVKVVPS